MYVVTNISYLQENKLFQLENHLNVLFIQQFMVYVRQSDDLCSSIWILVDGDLFINWFECLIYPTIST
jgi:hypothetical protein